MKYNPNPQMPKVERLANPEHKEEYKMPAEYQEQVKIMLELMEARDEYAKQLPLLSPEDYRKAKPLFDKLNASVEDLEEKLAYEYERYQEERRREQELSELTWQETMTEEHFIRVKHQRPYIFEEFAEEVMDGMTDEEREEHNRIVARREKEELEDILSGKIQPEEYENLYIKLRLPDRWIAELLLQIVYHTFYTDIFFEICYEALERLDEMHRSFRFQISDSLPVRRRNIEEAIPELIETLGSGRRFLLNYAEEAIKSGKFKPLKEGFTKYLDDHIKYLDKNIFWKYVVIKHTMSAERLEEYTHAATEGFTPEETEAFFKRAAECEEKDLDSLMESIETERITDARVEKRRAAPGYKKIAGPELSDKEKYFIQSSLERRRKREEETPPAKIEYDTRAIFNRYLKILRAATDGGGHLPVRYEDEQSRKDDEVAKASEDAMRNIETLYIIFKHQKPEKFEEFHNVVLQGMLPEFVEEFSERIAYLEATQLEEILSGK